MANPRKYHSTGHNPTAFTKVRRSKAVRPIVPHPSNTDRIYDDDETELIRAMAAYQSRTGVRYPTWGEVLAILKQLGYRKP